MSRPLPPGFVRQACLAAGLLFAAGLWKGIGRGEGWQLALVSSAVIVGLFGVLAGFVVHRYRAGEVEPPTMSGPPGEGSQPPGWWWDRSARRWRKPARKR